MKFKKRYFLAALAIGLFATCHSGCMSFKKTEQEQREIIVQRTGSQPVFHSYEVGGQVIHYTQVGDPSLPLVLLVHGSPGSSSEVLDFLTDTALLQVAQVVGVDRPGFGASGYGKGEPSLEKQAAVLLPILKKYGHTKAILVGHSYGGPVIARAAMDYPEQVGGLVIVAGSIAPDLEPGNWWRYLFDWKIFSWMLPPAMRAANHELLPLKSELEKMLPGWEKITCPVTVIQGAKDGLVAPGNADFAEKMLVRSQPVRILRIEGQGHFVFWNRRDMVVAEIIKMLRLPTDK